MPNRPGTAVIDESALINSTPEQVWHAIVDGGARSRWWGYLNLDAQPGGRFEERWADERGEPRLTSGHVTTVVEPTTLCLHWADDDWPAATDVEIQIHRVDSGSTAVRVRHSGWERLPDGDHLLEQHREGWKAHLANLRDHLTQ